MAKMQKEAVKVKVPPMVAGFPLSLGIKLGQLVFVSGQGPHDLETGDLIHGTIQEETALTFENIKRILEAAGTSMENVVKFTIFLKDFNDYPGMNEIRRKYVGKVPPASSTVQVSHILGDTRVEIETIAFIPEK